MKNAGNGPFKKVSSLFLVLYPSIKRHLGRCHSATLAPTETTKKWNFKISFYSLLLNDLAFSACLSLSLTEHDNSQASTLTNVLAQVSQRPRLRLRRGRNLPIFFPTAVGRPQALQRLRNHASHNRHRHDLGITVHPIQVVDDGSHEVVLGADPM